MTTEKDSDYETYELTSIRSDEYETPYKRDDTISESEQLCDNEYDAYGDHYADYQKHSRCGRQIDFENEYAEYECGRSDTDSQKAEKEKKKWCIRCSISCIILVILGALTFGIWWNNPFGISALVDTPVNSTSSFEVTHDASFTEPVLSTTTTTSTSMIPKKTEAAKPSLPSAIELSGTTTENYWKDYQLLGLYNNHGTRNGAPAYKRARNAFILGEIYFWYVSRCKGNEWVVTSKQEFDADKDCPGRWLWKQSDETDPSKIGQGQSEKERKKWGEAEQFGGKMHTATITVKAFYN